MNVGIIGAGNIGSVLGRYLIELGHQVVIANSRGPESLQEVATQTGATPVTVEEAANAKDLVIITIPEKEVPNLPLSILAASKAIVVDTGNYYPSRDGKIADVEEGIQDSEWVAKVIRHPVIKAFNNIYALSLSSKALPSGTPKRVALSVSGDDAGEKEIVMGLIEEIGFDAIDAGSLSESWRQQPGTPSYCHDLDKNALLSALQEAEQSMRMTYLEKADEQIRPFL